jgi:hypothetical protein
MFEEKKIIFNEKIESFQKIFCLTCNYNLETEDIYCPECGTKTKQEEIECRICNTVNFSDEFCSDCGSNLLPKSCPKCSTETYGDFCESCGVPISDLGQSFLQNSSTIREPETLSMAEANEILESFQTRLSPETKRMQEKMRQRIILQREREIFQEREERIKNYHSSGIKKIEVIQTEEFKKIREQMKTFSGYIKRKVEEKEAEEERERQRLQKIEEAKRAEEARLKRLNRVNGIWVSTIGNACVICEISHLSSTTSGRLTIENSNYEFLDILLVNWNDKTLSFHTDKRFIKCHLSDGRLGNIYFNGRVSDDGESMMGYMTVASGSDERSLQVMFFKN